MSDDAMRARVEGRARVASRTVWQLTIDQQRFRCLRADGGYAVEAISNGVWTPLGRLFSRPAVALARLLDAPSVKEALAKL